MQIPMENPLLGTAVDSYLNKIVLSINLLRWVGGGLMVPTPRLEAQTPDKTLCGKVGGFFPMSGTLQ